MITYGYVINSTTNNTHTPCTIFLRNQKNRNSARTKAFSYIPAVQKILNLSLNPLSLFRVCLVCTTVWQTCSWNQINLMLNSPQWWHPRGYLFGKKPSLYSYKRLVTVGGKVLAISSMENKAFLQIKA